MPPSHIPGALSSSDPVYKTHEDQIAWLRERAEALGESKTALADVSGATVICEQTAFTKSSVESLLIAFEQRFRAEEAKELNGQWVMEARGLLYDVLSTHFAIRDAKRFNDPAFSEDGIMGYRERIAEMENTCRAYGVPSPMQHLMSGRALREVLHDPLYHIADGNGRHAVLTQLGHLTATQDPHFPALVEALVFQDRFGDVLELVEMAATRRRVTIPQLLRSNNIIGKTYVRSLFKSGDYPGTIVTSAEWIGLPVVGRSMLMSEGYIRSLLECERYQEVVEFLDTHLDVSPDHNLQKTIRIAAKKLAWWYLGHGCYTDGMGVLEDYASDEIGDNGRGDVRNLYLRLRKLAKR